MPLTPAASDPNRKDELKRREADPDSFGAVKMGAGRTIVPNAAPKASADDEEKQAKAKQKGTGKKA